MDADQVQERATDNRTKAQVRLYVCTPVPSWPKFWYVLVRLNRKEVFEKWNTPPRIHIRIYPVTRRAYFHYFQRAWYGILPRYRSGCVYVGQY